ncbi:MAG: hypothetical protein QJT81_04115 [Candidatus Thiothrix putei]|uniref:Serine protease n=1 Tax=Candidatus Thiothrix putei TaxID=3080811 RepID=A0AA95HD10_9GAMM|nr:MAG: hypothetical protein QJT81_04115 [Candidatus Thiothrix putei]
MKYPVLFSISTLLLIGSLSVLPIYAADITQVDGLEQADLPSNEAAAAWEVPATLRLDPTDFPKRAGRGALVPQDIVLPPLSAAELQQWQQTADEPQQRRTRIGMSRAVPNTLGEPDTWQWLAVEGGQVAHLGWRSPDAKRIRGQFVLGNLPAGVELRFYAPHDPQQVYAYTHDTLKPQIIQQAGEATFWSPSLAGDTLRVEVFVPEGIAPDALALRVVKLSHSVLDPLTGAVQRGTLEDNAVACFVDMACATPEWQLRGSSTALFLVVNEDIEYFCTGELLNNTRADGKPYFLTANHCVDSAAVATTLNSFWFYENSSCGGSDARDKVLRADGGATLLVTDKTLDTTLLSLNKIPAQGVLFAGWSNRALPSGQAIAGIHHALTLPKQFALGTFVDYGTFAASGLVRDPQGEFAVVRWLNGTTDKGASGSGLWFEEQGKYYVNGVLSRGTSSSSCERPDGIALYGRFDQAYPLLKPWLSP